MLIPLGMIMGFFVVMAEPAVHVLNKQVEEITVGAISKRSMLLRPFHRRCGLGGACYGAGCDWPFHLVLPCARLCDRSRPFVLRSENLYGDRL